MASAERIRRPAATEGGGMGMEGMGDMGPPPVASNFGAFGRPGRGGGMGRGGGLPPWMVLPFGGETPRPILFISAYPSSARQGYSALGQGTTYGRQGAGTTYGSTPSTGLPLQMASRGYGGSAAAPAQGRMK